ncbi:hypothetical protein ACFXJ8_43180 [Nonomuraea sp. NPDC059194]|uniref:hypothetical protein n=1 Tax=Nonomuraea sp. NPDC059194 TaxID=3346764 RepID=UPI0036873C6E
MSDSGAADAEDRAGEAAAQPPFEPARVVPTRPDGWPDWLGRRPISSVDRDRILKDLSADQEELDAVKRQDGLRLAPLFSSVTIEGFGGPGDPRKVARLRAAINAGSRQAIGGPAITRPMSASRSGSLGRTRVSGSRCCAGSSPRSAAAAAGRSPKI